MKYTTETWIEAAKAVHGNDIIYDLVEYKGSHEKVTLICAKCGRVFEQEARAHLAGAGCKVCSMKKVGEYNRKVRNGDQGTLTTDDYKRMAREVHGDEYDYDKVEYVNMNTKVCNICHKKDENGVEHGEFWQTPRLHIHRKHGCPKCNGGIKDTQNIFCEKVHKMYGDLYDTSKVEYKKSSEKVCIICHKKDKYGHEHGEFFIRPNSLLRNHGCPKCSQSKLEEEIQNTLLNYSINFIREKTFKWLKYEGLLRLDFYLPEYNIAIECQGEQHYKPTDFANKGKKWALKLFKYNKKRDEIKKEYCNKNGIKILYYTNQEVDDIDIFKDSDKLIKHILYERIN